MSDCQCSNCRQKEAFDAKAAFEELSRRQTELGDIMMRYMTEASLKRSRRAENALEMATAVSLIFGGEPTSEFPECCSVAGTDNCSGVLIHKRVVLSAAHCRNPATVRLNSTTRSSGGELINVLRSRRHPDYNPATNFFDIRVLILQRASTVLPVRMATPQQFLAAGQTTLVGYGRSEVGTGVKRTVTVEIDPEPDIDFFDLEREFRAGGDGQDTCSGDSGGPAYIRVGNGFRVAGLTSRGINGHCGDGGIYTRVDAHLDFIREVAGESGITI